MGGSVEVVRRFYGLSALNPDPKPQWVPEVLAEALDTLNLKPNKSCVNSPGGLGFKI